MNDESGLRWAIVAATPLLERVAAGAAQIALIEAARSEAIAQANQSADRQIAPLVAEQERLKRELAPWWVRHGAALTGGKRKSAELGGCMIGTKASAAKLGVAGDEKALVERMRAIAWARKLLRPSWSLDRAALLQALGGKRKGELEALGLSTVAGKDVFFVKAVGQAGTMGA